MSIEEMMPYFEKTIPVQEFFEGKTTYYKTSEDEPVALRRVKPNSSEDSQFFALMNEDPRTIHGMSGYAKYNEEEKAHENDLVQKSTEDVESKFMPPSIQLAIVGDSGVPDKYQGKVLGWVEYIKADDPDYLPGGGFFDFPQDTLILDLVYAKRFFKWSEDLNTPEMVDDLPTQNASKNRKDLWFARNIGNNTDLDEKDLHNVMLSGVKQSMQLIVDREKLVADNEKKDARKIVYTASVRQDNMASSSLLEKLGFKKHPKEVEEDGENFDIWYFEAN